MCYSHVSDFFLSGLLGPIPREATRLRLYNEELGFEAHLSASVCDHGNIELYRYITALQFLHESRTLTKGGQVISIVLHLHIRVHFSLLLQQITQSIFCIMTGDFIVFL